MFLKDCKVGDKVRPYAGLEAVVEKLGEGSIIVRKTLSQEYNPSTGEYESVTPFASQGLTYWAPNTVVEVIGHE